MTMSCSRGLAGSEWISSPWARTRRPARAAAHAGGVAAIGWEPIKEIKYERTDIYYDFTVEKYHNYVMAGIVHHNTGKTLIGIAAVHKHAHRSRRQGGYGGKYRAIVLCPDHLVGKWCREIKETIRPVTVVRFGPQGEELVVGKKGRSGQAGAGPRQREQHQEVPRDVLALLQGRVKPGGNRWEKPQGAEWYVLGRNQAKWLSDWAGIAEPQKSFNIGGAVGGMAITSLTASTLSAPRVIVEREEVKDDCGHPVLDEKWNVVTRPSRSHPLLPQVRDHRPRPEGCADGPEGSHVAEERPPEDMQGDVPQGPLRAEQPNMPGGEIIAPPRSSSLHKPGTPRSSTTAGSGSCGSAASRSTTTRAGPTAGLRPGSSRRSSSGSSST